LFRSIKLALKDRSELIINMHKPIVADGDMLMLYFSV